MLQCQQKTLFISFLVVCAKTIKFLISRAARAAGSYHAQRGLRFAPVGKGELLHETCNTRHGGGAFGFAVDAHATALTSNGVTFDDLEAPGVDVAGLTGEGSEGDKFVLSKDLSGTDDTIAISGIDGIS